MTAEAKTRTIEIGSGLLSAATVFVIVVASAQCCVQAQPGDSKPAPVETPNVYVTPPPVDSVVYRQDRAYRRIVELERVLRERPR